MAGSLARARAPPGPRPWGLGRDPSQLVKCGHWTPVFRAPIGLLCVFGEDRETYCRNTISYCAFHFKANLPANTRNKYRKIVGKLPT